MDCGEKGPSTCCTLPLEGRGGEWTSLYNTEIVYAPKMCSTSSIPPGFGDAKGRSGMFACSKRSTGISGGSSSVDIASSTSSSIFQCMRGRQVPGLEFTRWTLSLITCGFDRDRRREWMLLGDDEVERECGERSVPLFVRGERDSMSISCGLKCSQRF